MATGYQNGYSSMPWTRGAESPTYRFSVYPMYLVSSKVIERQNGGMIWEVFFFSAVEKLYFPSVCVFLISAIVIFSHCSHSISGLQSTDGIQLRAHPKQKLFQKRVWRFSRLSFWRFQEFTTEIYKMGGRWKKKVWTNAGISGVLVALILEEFSIM